GPVERQQLGVTPHAARPARDGLAGEARLDRVVVVGDLERSEAQLAHVQRGLGVFFPAFAALEAQDRGLAHGCTARARPLGAPGRSAAPRFRDASILAAARSLIRTPPASANRSPSSRDGGGRRCSAPRRARTATSGRGALPDRARSRAPAPPW